MSSQSKKISPKTDLAIQTILKRQKDKAMLESSQLSRASTEKEKSRSKQKKDLEESVELLANKQPLPSKSMDFMEMLKIGLDLGDKGYIMKSLDKGLSRLIPNIQTLTVISNDIDLSNVFLIKLLKDINSRIKSEDYSEMDDLFELVELKTELETKLGVKSKPKKQTNRPRSKSLLHQSV